MLHVTGLSLLSGLYSPVLGFSVFAIGSLMVGLYTVFAWFGDSGRPLLFVLTALGAFGLVWFLLDYREC
jgi:hypothetical protein